MVKLNHLLYEELQNTTKGCPVMEDRKDVWKPAMESSEQMLEKWETALLKMQ